MIKIDFAKLRFLVVEDNSYMRKIIKALLSGYGAREVYEAEEGASGLEAFQSYAPDIVITDWLMPIIDGIELTRLLRNPRSSTNPYVPIIMVSAHTEKRRIIQARDAGVTEFLCKPISATALHQRILNVIVNPRPFIKTSSYFGPDRRRFINPDYNGEERRLEVNPGEIIDAENLLPKVNTYRRNA